MNVVAAVTENGIVESRFDLSVEGQTVPGIMWEQEGAIRPRPVILIGHGATQNKRVANVLTLARRFVTELGYAAVAIDAPEHGERVVDAAASDEARRRLQQRLAAGPGQGPVFGLSAEGAQRWADNLARASREWKATVDLLEADGVVAGARVGFWGVSMGTSIGLPFVASDPRVHASVFGLAGIPSGESVLAQAAMRLKTPVLFLLQWDDELIPRESGLRLYDTIASSDRTMHVHPGGHLATPAYERADYVAFFKRHLGA